MSTATLRRSIHRVSPSGVETCEDTLASQCSCRIFVDGRLAGEAVCSPGGLASLGLGFLLTGGFVPREWQPPEAEENEGEVRFLLGGAPSPSDPGPVDSNLTATAGEVLGLVDASARLAVIHASTGGTHVVAIGLDGAIRLHYEDVSRTSAFEKAVGAAWTAGLPLDRSILVLSSRIPLDFVLRAARACIPIVAAVSAPTAQAADAAGRLGICLCGFVRGRGMNVYSSPWRLGL